MDFHFFVSILVLGIGLAMDAISVSLTDGFKEPEMTKKRAVGISLIFGIFQATMPFIGWILAHTIVISFSIFEISSILFL